MKNKPFFLAFLISALLAFTFDAIAQKKKKTKQKAGKKRDAVYIKPAKIPVQKRPVSNAAPIYSGKDVVEKEGPLVGRFVDRTPISSPEQLSTLHRPEHILSEDTFSIADGEQSIVEVEEQFEIDTTWIKATEYYSIWDAYAINPYRSDISSFNEDLDIVLYDTAKGQLWSEPLKETTVTSEFGARWGRWHYGVDLGLNMGDPVLSVWDGVIRLTNWDPGGYGNYVLVRHYNGFETLYGHMSDITCTVGQIVQAGDMVGKGGSTGRSTGPHLHFEVRYRGVPINPLEIFDFRGEGIRGATYRLSSRAFNYMGRRPVSTPRPKPDQAQPPVYPTRKVYYHRIRKGDNLASISKKYGIPVNTLKKLNGIGKSSGLSSGKRLRIR